MNMPKRRYYRKHVELLELIDKIKLWPARSGRLHGIKTVAAKGPFAEITTHCGEHFVVYNSKNSRATRWLRNKWAAEPCKNCNIPTWKLDKYESTFFSGHFGSDLRHRKHGDNTIPE